ncbi:MAG: FtsX-like permease family protein [Brooklawnia sp.]|jgi:hypothetical protein
MNAPRASGLFSTGLLLARSRFTTREGESLLYLAGTLAFLICSALALTLAGGTMLFFNRWQQPRGILAELLGIDQTFDHVLMFYFVLALVACTLIVPSIFALASSAAVLGARGRERRLAALRLIGLSARDVSRMSLVDTLVQAVAGTSIGVVVYLVSLPLWGNLEMLALPLTAEEMLLDWYLIAAIALFVILLGLVSAWWGLRQVRISPLGVARQAARPGLKAWRLAIFAGVLIAGSVGLNALSLGRAIWGFGVLVGIMLGMIAAFNAVGPWFLQQFSKLFALARWPSVIWAARRIQASPQMTWHRVAGVSLLALIGGYVALMPISVNGDSAGEAGASFADAVAWDFTKGAIITLAIGFALTATSILINQASAVFERAEQSVAMARMGAPFSYGIKVMWLETLGPLVLAVTLGAALGAGMAYPMYDLARRLGAGSQSGPLIMVGVLVAGIGLASGALTACLPLQRQVLGAHRRVND